MNNTLQLTAITLLLSLVIHLTTNAQTKESYAPKTKNEVTTKTAQTIYKVQVGAYRYPERNNFEPFYKLGSVYREETKSGLWRIIIGDYNTKEESNKTLKMVRAAGYKDAYTFKDKVVVPMRPRKLLNPKTLYAGESADYLKKSLNKKAAEAYIVQVAAYTNVDFTNFLDISSVGDIYLEKSETLIKVAIGKYKSTAAAKQALKRLQSLGYSKAFIRKVDTNFGD
ncbi:MAG: SPOR domain-containing protein [Chitinophagales bacterium]